VDTLVVDKTGTLTEGKPSLQVVLPLPGFTEADLLRFAAAAEASSEHPLARSIVAGAAERGLAPLPVVTGFESDPGLGVWGQVDGQSKSPPRSCRPWPRNFAIRGRLLCSSRSTASPPVW